MGYATVNGVAVSAPQLLMGYHFTCCGFDHIRTGDIHLADFLDHEYEVGDGWRIDCATGAGAQDNGDLGDDAGSQGVAQENLPVACQANHPFLDACATRVVDADDGSAVLQRQVHDFANLLGDRFRQRAAKYGKVLGKHVH